MFEKFDYVSYKELIELVTNTHKNLCFNDFPIKDDMERYFILRHDVDFSPKFSLKMAEFEAEIGIRATYFVLFSSQFYNLLSEKYCDFPRKLIELGHDVGLHYDLLTYEKYYNRSPNEILKMEITMLTRLAGNDIKSIAQHNPSTTGNDPFKDKNEYINAYDPQFYKNIDYFSDSCGAWRDETVKLFNSGKIPNKFQLLIHPFYWDNLTVNRWARLDNFVNDKNTKLIDCADKIKEFWSNHIGVKQHDKRK